ncbi:hypothetical protein BK671_22355 [Pseudomonas fluorescens]|uniref:ATPase AAA-type core domain-containing protein n=1 Tax=Pseudomonas fluorescens TaxID=294 RepID=A0A423L477_PSEFL|nr:hypothetical protein BK671_22355 [Pseudomonas fluorescens]
MSFFNDMLQQSHRRQKQEKALSRENLADAGVMQAHLMHQTVLQSRFRFDVNAVMNSLRGEVFGQDQALNILEGMLKVVRADHGDPHRPLFIALFLGPTGVGKTEIVRASARALHGDADAFCRVDMNTLSREHYGASLTGAPPWLCRCQRSVDFIFFIFYQLIFDEVGFFVSYRRYIVEHVEEYWSGEACLAHLAIEGGNEFTPVVH